MCARAADRRRHAAEALLAACRTDHAPEDRRAVAAEALLTSLRPRFARLGITRAGLITGLDRVGGPVAFACRPNSRTLSVHLGRGLDDASAMVSAVMEAAEAAYAEERPDDLATATARDMAASGARTIDLARTLRCRTDRLDRAGAIAWIDGIDLVTGRLLTVPWDLVGLDHTGAPGPFDRASDGLGAGSTWSEAVLQGLGELIERDAAALQDARPPAALRRILPEALADPRVDLLCDRLDRAGLTLTLHDATSDIGLPVISARIRPVEDAGRPLLGVDLCAGWGCDADPATAAVRAVTEAVQARAAGIAGARDDILPDWYRRPAASDPDPETPVQPPPAAPAAPATRSERLADLLQRLQDLGMRSVVAVPIADGADGIHVVRMIVPGLEVGLETGRPGARLLSALIGRAA